VVIEVVIEVEDEEGGVKVGELPSEHREALGLSTEFIRPPVFRPWRFASKLILAYRSSLSAGLGYLPPATSSEPTFERISFLKAVASMSSSDSMPSSLSAEESEPFFISSSEV